MAHYKMLDGNAAVAEAFKMARVGLISAYPITPQSPIAEKLSEIIVSGELRADYIRVESEHSALSCAMGAQLTGVRSATATSSVGLALMHEILNVVSGCRVPIVMPVVNRSLAAPWSLWCDHQDSMAERDSGWIQLYCENVQDVFDSVIMAYRIAEHPDVLLPVMICLDGFFLSHSMQKVLLPEQSEIDDFIGAYRPRNLILDPEDPVVINNLTGSNENEEMRYQLAVAFENAQRVMAKVFAGFEGKFGRAKSMAEGYRLEDAEAALICLGSMAGTAKYVADTMREQGVKAGVVKVNSFRPFPAEQLKQLLGRVKRVAVIDRSAGFGAQGAPLWLETRAALPTNTIVKGFVAGLAGRDINMQTIEKVFHEVLAAENDGAQPLWIDCNTTGAMHIREVERYV